MKFKSETMNRQKRHKPAEIGKALRLNAGDKLNCFVNEEEQIVLVPAKGSIKDLKGMFPKPKKAATQEDIDSAVAEEAASRMADL
ncbi:hypothetical protein AAFN60_18810 [Roseibacillus persicicus]|uniref:AbrB/MazE/SpoVT family DNA-binding domain-containing protein n=1 Tax=Roseibacillus persicicus TaxID=454148 RepID=UPI00398AF699